MELIQTIFYFFITIGILVLVHELGHFVAAKLSGMRVDRFSIGFPPRAFGMKIKETDYCISWIPIGGYVKIAGMIDESMDTEFANKPPEKWEFRSKPLLAKIFVLSAGVIMNVLLAVGIFWMISYSQGKFLKETTEIGYVIDASPAAKIGLQSGDIISTINDSKITHWDEINSKIYIENVGKNIFINLLRNGESKGVIFPKKDIDNFSGEIFGIYPKYSATVITGIEPGKPAELLGLKPGDIVYSINDQLIFFDKQIVNIIKSNPEKEISITWIRGADTLSGITTPTAEGKIGIGIGMIYNGPKKEIEYSLFEAFPAGVKSTVFATTLFFHGMQQLFTGKVKFSESIGGPVKIAQLATQSAEMGVTSFFAFMALLSITLAFINIVPFPALDGGHILILLIEGIIRREIPIKAKMAIQQTGFFILLAFMAYVIFNDIVNLW